MIAAARNSVAQAIAQIGRAFAAPATDEDIVRESGLYDRIRKFALFEDCDDACVLRIAAEATWFGLPGGADNPLGARALYLYQGNKDTLYRIHGTNEEDKIGQSVSSGCIRMRDIDVIDLYNRVKLGSKVIVL